MVILREKNEVPMPEDKGTSMCVVITTAPTEEEANRIARMLVERRLAACVQRMPMRSIYRWQGELVDEEEYLLLVKTTVQRYQEIEKAIQEVHPYQVPEIIQLDVTRSLPAYVEWLRMNVEVD